MVNRSHRIIIVECSECKLQYTARCIGKEIEDDVYAIDVANLRNPCCSDNLKIPNDD